MTSISRRLHAERVALHTPLSISPFVSTAEIQASNGAGLETEEIEDEKGTPVTPSFHNELRVRVPEESFWVDLVSDVFYLQAVRHMNCFKILEIAMTTALANLS